MENGEFPHIKVKKEDAQALIKFIENYSKKTSILNKKYKVIKENEYIFFPLNYMELNNEKIIDSTTINVKFEIVKKRGIRNKNYKYRTLEEALKTKIPEKFIELIPKSFDIIGNCAIVELDTFNDFNISLNIKKKIALAILNVNKNVRSVFEKISEIKGTFRLRKLKILAGNNNTETIHKENSCFFKLDVEKTFFSPRLLSERKRISSCINIKPNEKIVDLFAGVGPFSIQIAKKKNVEIYAFDINPNAIKYLKENIKLNKLKGIIIPELIDVNNLLKNSNLIGVSLKSKVDRVLMNLPENSLKFINIACYLIKEKGGIIHNYQFCDKPASIEKAIKNFEIEIKKNNYKLHRIDHLKILKQISPKTDMIVIDAFIKK